MGQKVNPIGFRLGVNRDWRSRWYASPQEMPEFLHSDIQIRDYVKKKLQFAAVAKIIIERAWNSIRVTIHTARPGIVIGRNTMRQRDREKIAPIRFAMQADAPRVASVNIAVQCLDGDWPGGIVRAMPEVLGVQWESVYPVFPY